MRHVLAVAVAITILAACTGSPAGGPAPGSTDRILHVLLADDWAPASAVVDAVQEFEREHPGVRVSVRGVAFGQIEETVRTDLAGPRELDVVQWHAFAAGASGFAQPIDDLFQQAFEAGHFIPGAIDDVTWGGRIYGVPLDVNAVVLLVNVDAVEAAGHTIEELATWDGVREVAASLAGDGVRFTDFPASSWTTYAWIRANGGEIFDFDAAGSPVFSFDDPRTIAAFEFLRDLVAAEQAFAPNSQDTSLDGVTLFVDGASATLATGSWDIAALAAHPPEFEWTVLPMPAGPSSGDHPRTVLGGSSLFLSRFADDRQLAFDLAAHLVRAEHSLRYAQDDGRLPPQVDVLADPFFDDPRYRVVVDNLPYADAMRVLAFPQLTELYTDAISDMLRLQAEPADALPVVQRQAADLAAQDLADAVSQNSEDS